jgi:ComF family protein
MEELERKTAGFDPRPLLGELRSRVAQVGDFVFPPTCPGCGRINAAHGALCQSCWQDVSFIERPYCEVLGTPFSHDLGPGFLSAEAIASPPVFDRLRAVCLFDGTARKLVHALKYRDRTELAPMMALWMTRAGSELLDRCDLVVPVPLHRWRLLSRRFNQSAELARHVAALSGRPFDGTSIRRRRRTLQQIGLGKNQREANMRGAFEVTAQGKLALAGRHIVLVDDVYTTGATVSAATRAIKRAGATEVSVLTFGIAIASPAPHTI